MLMPGEFVMKKSAVNKIGVANLARMNGGDAAFNARQLGQLVSSAQMQRTSATKQESVTINATIVQHTSAPDTSGAAVVSALRGIAHRSGRGLKVG
jgi:hypothetical protein